MRALSIASRGRGALTLAPKARMRSRPLLNQRDSDDVYYYIRWRLELEDSWLGAPRPAEGKECGVSRTCASLPKGFLESNSSESNQHGRIRRRRCYTSCRCNRRTGPAGSWIMEMIKSVTIIVLVHPLPSTSPLPSSLIPCSAISQFLPSPHVAPLHWPAV